MLLCILPRVLYNKGSRYNCATSVDSVPDTVPTEPQVTTGDRDRIRG